MTRLIESPKSAAPPDQLEWILKSWNLNDFREYVKRKIYFKNI